MSTLYKRATPRQHRILRAVEGAVRNAAHAHPRWSIDDKMARSIAKRAAGTLSAQWRGVLAVPSVAAPSAKASAEPLTVGRRPAALADEGGRSGPRSPFKRDSMAVLLKSISRMAGEARRNGDGPRLAALVDVLRLIAKVQA